TAKRRQRACGPCDGAPSWKTWRPTLVREAEGNTGGGETSSSSAGSAGVREQGTCARASQELGSPRRRRRGGGTAERRKRSEVRGRRGVGALRSTEEAGEPSRRDPVEGRRRRVEEPNGGPMGETSSSQTVSTKLERIAKLAKQAPGMVLTTL